MSKKWKYIFLLLSFFTILSGCGWQMQKQASLPYSRLSIIGVITQSFYDDLKKALHIYSIQCTKNIGEGDVILEIITEKNTRQVLSYNTLEKVSTYRITSQIQFKIFDINGIELLPESNIFAIRDLDFRQEDLQSFDYIIDIALEDIQKDILKQLLRYLFQLKKIN